MRRGGSSSTSTRCACSGEEFFGKEVTLPRLQISYRVQNSLQGGAALQGRETQYSLVPVPIRVLSLVPAGSTDIRDTPVDTFGDVDARLFRSNLLLIARGRRVRAGRADGRDGARARGGQAPRDSGRRGSGRCRPAPCFARRRASWVPCRRASQSGGWNRELAGRAAAALRLAGAVALSRPSASKRSIATRRQAKDRSPPAPVRHAAAASDACCPRR